MTGGWNAVAASVSGVDSAAYGTQGGRMFRPGITPAEYTDDTLITVPVLETTTSQPQQPVADSISFDRLTIAKEANKNRSKERRLFSSLRSSKFNALSDKRVNVTIRQVPRIEYQKHYMKDEHGRYIGTEDPAEDCILSEEDSARWRPQAGNEALLVDLGQDEGSWKRTAEGAGVDGRLSTDGQNSFGTSSKKSKFGLFRGPRGGDQEKGVLR